MLTNTTESQPWLGIFKTGEADAQTGRKHFKGRLRERSKFSVVKFDTTELFTTHERTPDI